MAKFLSVMDKNYSMLEITRTIDKPNSIQINVNSFIKLNVLCLSGIKHEDKYWMARTFAKSNYLCSISIFPVPSGFELTEVYVRVIEKSSFTIVASTRVLQRVCKTFKFTSVIASNYSLSVLWKILTSCKLFTLFIDCFRLIWSSLKVWWIAS